MHVPHMYISEYTVLVQIVSSQYDIILTSASSVIPNRVPSLILCYYYKPLHYDPMY
jgi:hypothetical protein